MNSSSTSFGGLGASTAIAAEDMINEKVSGTWGTRRPNVVPVWF